MTRLSLLAACVLLLVCASSVHAAGFIKARSKPTVPAEFGRPAHFPSADAIAASPELQALYAGDAKITVHVVPHTHDDVGWLKTVDQYFLGANNSIQHAAVHHILDTVVEELQKNPARKFIYVEQAFFQLWWMRQSDEIQAQTKALIANGQIEFINGGWCMHDEVGHTQRNNDLRQRRQRPLRCVLTVLRVCVLRFCVCRPTPTSST